MGLKLDMIGITVSDMTESLRFYRLLDIEVADPEPGEPYVEAVLPSGIRLSWNALAMMKDLDPDWEEPAGQRQGLAFLCEGEGSVDAAYAKIVDAGFKGKRAPWDAFWGQRYALVLDPDGNEVALFHPLPEG